MITGGFGMTMDLERGTMRHWVLGTDGVKRWADTNEPMGKPGLPGEQYKPSNSDEGYAFLGYWCANCQRDKAMRDGCDFDECDDNEKCEIIAASFRGEAVEWRDTGTGLICTAFVPAGEKVPERCPLTVDMFEAPNA